MNNHLRRHADDDYDDDVDDKAALDIDLSDRVTENPDGSKTLKLTRPMTITRKKAGAEAVEEVIDELTFEKPTAGLVRAVTKGIINDPIGAGYDLALELANLPAKLIERHLDCEDVVTLGTVGLSFIVRPPKTGNASSKSSR